MKTLPKSELLEIGYLDQIREEINEAPMCRDLLKTAIKTFGDDWPTARDATPGEVRMWLRERAELIKLLRKVVR